MFDMVLIVLVYVIEKVLFEEMYVMQILHPCEIR